MFCAHCGKEQKSDGNFCHNCGQQNLVSAVSKTIPNNTAEPVSYTISNVTKEEYTKRKSRNKKIGLAWLIAPFISLVIILSVYGVTNFVINSLVTASDVTAAADASGLISKVDPRVTTARVIRTAMSLLGIISVIGIMVGIPLGIIYLNKREEYPGMKIDNRSGLGPISIIPPEIGEWNWGAAGLSLIWGLSHRVWISLLVFVPIVNIFFWIYLGINGNELAWRADKWESVESFKQTQNKWKPWGIIFFVLGCIVGLGSAFK
jgi:hypothetical protein